MTKEEVKAAIAAKIAGQGNQLDLSGQLDTILSAIVDLIPEGGNEPYIVQGAVINREGYNSPVIVVPEQEYARAKEAFLAGRTVFIPQIDNIAYQATAYSLDVVEEIEDPADPVEGLTLYAKSATDRSDGACDALVSQ